MAQVAVGQHGAFEDLQLLFGEVLAAGFDFGYADVAEGVFVGT